MTNPLRVVGGTAGPAKEAVKPSVPETELTTSERVLAAFAEMEKEMIGKEITPFLDAVALTVRKASDEASTILGDPSEKEDVKAAAKKRRSMLTDIGQMLVTKSRDIPVAFHTHLLAEIKRDAAFNLANEHSWGMKEDYTLGEEARIWMSALTTDREYAETARVLREKSDGLSPRSLEVGRRALSVWQLTLSEYHLSEEARKWLRERFTEYFSPSVQRYVQQAIQSIVHYGYLPPVTAPAAGMKDAFDPGLRISPEERANLDAMVDALSGSDPSWVFAFGGSGGAQENQPWNAPNSPGIQPAQQTMAPMWMPASMPVVPSSGPVIPHWQRAMGFGMPVGAVAPGSMLSSLPAWGVPQYGNNGGGFPLMPHSTAAFAPIGTPMPPQYFHAVLAQQSMPWQVAMPQIAGAHALMELLSRQVSPEVSEAWAQSMGRLQLALAQRYVSGNLTEALLREVIRRQLQLESMLKAGVSPNEAEAYVREVMPESAEVTIAAEAKGPTAEESEAIIAEERRIAAEDEQSRREEMDRIAAERRASEEALEKKKEALIEQARAEAARETERRNLSEKLQSVGTSVAKANEEIQRAVGAVISLPPGVEKGDIEEGFLRPVRRNYHENSDQLSREGKDMLTLLKEVLEWDTARKGVPSLAERTRGTTALLTRLAVHLTKTRLPAPRQEALQQTLLNLWTEAEETPTEVKPQIVVVPEVSLPPAPAPSAAPTPSRENVVAAIEKKAVELKGEISAKSENDIVRMLMRTGEMFIVKLTPDQVHTPHLRLESYYHQKGAVFTNFAWDLKVNIPYSELVGHLVTGNIFLFWDEFTEAVKTMKELRGTPA